MLISSAPGDYRSLVTLRWFMFYRALVRALVASIRAGQENLLDVERSAAIQDARDHIQLAYRFTLREAPSLWITHGVSGSGKNDVQ